MLFVVVRTETFDTSSEMLKSFKMQKSEFIYKIQSKVIQCSLVKPPPSVQSVVWRYNEFGDKLRGIENWKLCDHMKR